MRTNQSAARWLRTTGRRGVLLAVMAVSACGGTRNSERYFVPADHPPEVQENFVTFARRCSKCHSLARPLVAGVTDVAHWDHYVARMVRRPGSGITPNDVQPILAFLYYYTTEVRGLGEPDDEETLPAPSEAVENLDDVEQAPAPAPESLPTSPYEQTPAADAPPSAATPEGPSPSSTQSPLPTADERNADDPALTAEGADE